MRTTRGVRTTRLSPARLERAVSAPLDRLPKLTATVSRCIAPAHAATPHAAVHASVSHAATQRKQATRIAGASASMRIDRRADATLAATPPPRSATPRSSRGRQRPDCRPMHHAKPE
ncbi:hypothetical protein WK92_26205 [Burkholderia ubonensis]|nr:hypothetical protein WK82_22805 [Burkholderia ubonensis]KVW31279.1 hypothetical protein WK92_26205 [Burkholderia ubonensis]